LTSKKVWEIASKLRGYEFTAKMKMRILEYYIFRKKYPTVFNHWSDEYTINKHAELIAKKEVPMRILPDEEGYFNYVTNADDTWIQNQDIYNILNGFELQDIQDFLADDSFGDKLFYENTPQSIIDLAIALLKKSTKGRNLLDLCSGTGSFLYAAKENGIASKYYGVEINADSHVLSLIKMHVGKKADFEMIRDNVFNPIDILTNKSKTKFAGVFSNFPFGLRIQESLKVNLASYYQTKNDLPLQRRNTADYSFITLMLRNLEKDGKAIAILHGGALVNTIDQDVRKHLVDHGLVESVYELPDRMFNQTSIKTYMLVLSFGNKKIQFANLSSCIKEKQRNTNVLDVEKALDIINGSGNSEHQISISASEVDGERYSLVPAVYLNQSKIDLIHARNLEDVAEVFTGWQVSSSQLDERFVTEYSDSDTVTQIVQMGDVNEGIINRNTNFYKVDQRQVDKFSLKNEDVIISTKSLKVKSAVVEIDDDRTLIASGSIMVIRVDKSIMDPYYLRAFLDSSIGQELLALKQTGNVIPNLTVNNVKTLQVPVLDLDKQKKLANQYRDKFDKIVFEKKRLEKLEKEIDSLFDFVVNGDTDE
jgi:type I restriction enzyme M protein